MIIYRNISCVRGGFIDDWEIGLHDVMKSINIEKRKKKMMKNDEK